MIATSEPHATWRPAASIAITVPGRLGPGGPRVIARAEQLDDLTAVQRLRARPRIDAADPRGDRGARAA